MTTRAREPGEFCPSRPRSDSSCPAFSDSLAACTSTELVMGRPHALHDQTHTTAPFHDLQRCG